MKNEVYLQSIGVTDEQARVTCLEAMAKYGDNHWWEPDVSLRTYAYYAVKEPLYLDAAHNSGRLGRGLMELLGRFVHPYETVANEVALLQEVERAWIYGVGCTSEAEQAERVEEGALAVAELMRQRDIPVMVSKEESE